MISFCGGKSFFRARKTFTFSQVPIPVLTLTLVLASVAVAPLCRAESVSTNSGVSLDKHARKVYRQLTHFNPGNYIRLKFTDKSERTVALDSLEDTTFTVTNAESNNRETHAYAEVAHVTRERDYIGEGSEGHVRHIKLWIPITVGVLAAGAAVTAAEVW